MDYLNQYIIPFNGLDNNKDYDYSFVVDDIFFSFFEKSIIKGGHIDINVLINKNVTSLNLEIKLKGYIVITCDRCLDDYNQDIEFKDSIFVTFGDETDFDNNEDFVVLDRSINEINISQFIYEFANFALPFAHYHPNDKNGNSTCNPEMLKIIGSHVSQQEDINIIDYRWEKLIEIQNNNVK